MPYYPLVPVAGQRINNSRPQIAANFTAINNYFGTDHINFVSAANNGKHNKVTFFPQGAAPVPGVGEISLYNMASSLFLRKAAGAPLDITAGDIHASLSGYSNFPSGIIIKYGSGTTNGAGVGVVDLTAVIYGDVYTATPLAIVCPLGTPLATHFVTVAGISNTTLTINSTGATIAFNWITIGK